MKIEPLDRDTIYIETTGDEEYQGYRIEEHFGKLYITCIEMENKCTAKKKDGTIIISRIFRK